MQFIIFRWGGWLLLLSTVVQLAHGEVHWGVAGLIVAAFILTIGYRVSAIFGVRLPWVRDDG